MTEHEFLSSMDSLLTGVKVDAISKSDACDRILQLVKGLLNNKRDLELFIALVSQTRLLQDRFTRERTNKAQAEARQLELRVDRAILKLLHDHGYDLVDIQTKAAQSTLF
jgi:hypothetical protein